MGIEVDTRISHGNLIVLAAMIGSIAVTWGEMKSGSESAFKEISNNKAAIAAQESRIRSVEQIAARQDERMILILESLRKIEKQFERNGYPVPPYKSGDHQ